MTTQELLTDLLNVEAQAKALDKKRTELRDALDQDLRTRWEEDGIATTLKAPGLGSVTLAGTEATAPQIVDDAAYLEWAREHHPDLVRTVTLVEASLLTALCKEGKADSEDRLVTPDGEVVPGVELRARRPWISIRLSAEAKARAELA